MKNVKILMVMLFLGQPLFAQDFKFNDHQAAELVELSLSISPTLQSSEVATAEATNALRNWFLGDFDKSPFDYVTDGYVGYCEVLMFKETEDSVLESQFNDMRTNLKGSSMADVAKKRTYVGAAYIEIFDPKKGKYFGTYLILFK